MLITIMIPVILSMLLPISDYEVTPMSNFVNTAGFLRFELMYRMKLSIHV